MTTWIALLRGINVGGKNVLPMNELTQTLAKAGYVKVRTYIQSGNVVFQSSKPSADVLAAHISEAIFASHGLTLVVVVIRADELREAVDANPYRTAEDDPKSLHLFFLGSVPSDACLEPLNGLKSETESFAIVGKVFYLHTPDGIARSKIARGVERALGVSATARNWRTVSKLKELAGE